MQTPEDCYAEESLKGTLRIETLLASPAACVIGIDNAIRIVQRRARTRLLSDLAAPDFVWLVSEAVEKARVLGHGPIGIRAVITSTERIAQSYRGVPEATGIFLRPGGTIYVARYPQSSTPPRHDGRAWIIARKSCPSERDLVARAIAAGFEIGHGVVYL